MSNKFVHFLLRLTMHSTKKLASKLTMNPQGGAAYSSTLQIHCETIAKLLLMVIVELCI